MLQRTVILGIGSNIDPIQNLRQCLQEVKNLHDVKILKISKIYESDAMLTEQAPKEWNQKYLNAAILIAVEKFSAIDFLQQIKSIELLLNRQSKGRWSPRTIDIDILYVKDFSYHSSELKVPHPELESRPFALLPLLEVFPEYQVKNCPWLKLTELPYNTKKSQNLVWPYLVGIVNLTTDSFSDGGFFLADKLQVNRNNLMTQVQKMIEDGADVLDLGAESTRPGAEEIPEEVEQARLIQALHIFQEAKISAKISIDCRKPQVMRRILEKFEIDFVNDVEGFRQPHMMELLSDTKAKAICMHSFSVPPLRTEVIPAEKNVFEELRLWWFEKLNQFAKHKISDDRLIFDVGIGFGLSSAQSFKVLENLENFYPIAQEIFIGHSRKSFLNSKTEKTFSQRDEETAQVTSSLNQAYCQYIRVHNIPLNKRALL